MLRVLAACGGSVLWILPDWRSMLTILPVLLVSWGSVSRMLPGLAVFRPILPRVREVLAILHSLKYSQYTRSMEYTMTIQYVRRFRSFNPQAS